MAIGTQGDIKIVDNDELLAAAEKVLPTLERSTEFLENAHPERRAFEGLRRIVDELNKE